MQTLKGIEIPSGRFGLMTQSDKAIVDAIRGRDKASVLKIVRALSQTPGVTLEDSDITQLLNRRGRLAEFEAALKRNESDESWWQDYFDRNKWIFGYG
jgi:hypothetical protein